MFKHSYFFILYFNITILFLQSRYNDIKVLIKRRDYGEEKDKAFRK